MALGFAPLHANGEGLKYEELKIAWEQQKVREENERQATEHRRSQELIAKAKALEGRRIGQCVIGVRVFLAVGPDKISGLAKNTKTNSAKPVVGAIIVTRESWAGHVGVVLAVVGNQALIFETNYRWTGRASMRWVNLSDPRIVGYKVI